MGIIRVVPLGYLWDVISKSIIKANVQVCSNYKNTGHYDLAVKFVQIGAEEIDFDK